MTIILYLIFYAVCALNLVWGLQKKKSNALYVGAFIVMFILMAFNFDGPDIGNYLATYASIGDAPDLGAALGSTYMESGYILLMFGANKLGLDFYAFRIVVTVVCFALVSSAIRSFKVNPNMIVGLYMVYLFFMDAIQFRNFAAMCIVLFSAKYLFRRTKLSYLQYVIGIICASFFHIIALVYLVLLVVKFIHGKKAMRVLFWCAMGLFAVCFVFRSLLVQAALRVIDALGRGFSYIQTATEIRFNPFIALVLQLFAVYPLLRYRNKIADKDARNKANIILAIELVILFFLPGSFINNNLNRIYRNMLILDTIGLALLYENTGNAMAKQTACIAQFFTVGGWLAIDLYRNSAERIIGKLMSCNLFCMPASANDILLYFVVTAFSILAVFAVKEILAIKSEARGNGQKTEEGKNKPNRRKSGREGGVLS